MISPAFSVLMSQVDVGFGCSPCCGEGLWVGLGGGREVEVHSVVSVGGLGVALPCIVLWK